MVEVPVAIVAVTIEATVVVAEAPIIAVVPVATVAIVITIVAMIGFCVRRGGPATNQHGCQSRGCQEPLELHLRLFLACRPVREIRVRLDRASMARKMRRRP
jgi:hypothetical protein